MKFDKKPSVSEIGAGEKLPLRHSPDDPNGEGRMPKINGNWR